MFPLTINNCNINNLLMYDGDSYILLNQAIANNSISKLVYTSGLTYKNNYPIDSPYYNTYIGNMVSPYKEYIIIDNMYYLNQSTYDYYPIYRPIFAYDEQTFHKPETYYLTDISKDTLIIYNSEIDTFILNDDILSSLKKLYIKSNNFIIENGTIYFKYDDNINLKYGEIPLDCEVIHMT